MCRSACTRGGRDKYLHLHKHVAVVDLQVCSAQRSGRHTVQRPARLRVQLHIAPATRWQLPTGQQPRQAQSAAPRRPLPQVPRGGDRVREPCVAARLEHHVWQLPRSRAQQPLHGGQLLPALTHGLRESRMQLLHVQRRAVLQHVQRLQCCTLRAGMCPWEETHRLVLSVRKPKGWVSLRTPLFDCLEWLQHPGLLLIHVVLNRRRSVLWASIPEYETEQCISI